MIAYVGAWFASGLNWSCNEIFGHEFAEPIPEGYCDTKIAPNCPQGQQCDLAQNLCVVLDSGVAKDVGKESETVPSIPCVDHAQCPFEQPLCFQNRCQNCMNDGICKSRFAGHEETCFEGKCVECSDSTICKTRYAGTKEVCASGACVECTTNAECKDASKPVCDKNACRVAQRNFECPDSALELDGSGNPTGKCNATTRIIYVDDNRTMTECMTALGTQSSPFCFVNTAITEFNKLVNKDKFDLILVKPSKNANGYQPGTPATITLNQSIRIVGSRKSATEGAPKLAIPFKVIPNGMNKITVSLEDLYFRKVQDTALECAGGTVDTMTLLLQYSWIESSKNVGLQSTKCKVEISNNVFVRNQESGVQLVESLLSKFWNNMIVQNGDPNANTPGGVLLEDVVLGSSFGFNTVVDNKGKQDGYNTKCIGVNAPSLEYSILIGNHPDVMKQNVKGCKVNSSVVPENAMGGGTNNISNYTPEFKSRTEDLMKVPDYHLTSADSQKLRVTPQGVTIPLYDIDGETRGTSTDIGADHYVAP